MEAEPVAQLPAEAPRLQSLLLGARQRRRALHRPRRALLPDRVAQRLRGRRRALLGGGDRLALPRGIGLS